MSKTGTDIEPAAGSDVAEVTPDAVAARALAGIEQRDLVLPVLKVTQQLSREVTAKKADSGQYINALTGEVYGDEIELIVCHYFKGRFYSPKDEDATWVAAGDAAPSNWPEEYAGKRFEDIPDAEETFRERANSEEGFEWGSGPPIRTTHNFVGFIPSEDEEQPLPVRLSLMRTSTPAARKIITLITFEGAPWNIAVDLSLTEEQDSQKRPYYVVQAGRGRQTTAEERQNALRLATKVQESQVQLAGDDNLNERREQREAAESGDGLDVT